MKSPTGDAAKSDRNDGARGEARVSGARDDASASAPTLFTPSKRSVPSSTSAASASARVMERLAARGPLSTRYRLDGEIARGGMGAILEVFDEDLRRKLAMKVVLESEREPSPEDSSKPTRLARFLEEAQITGQLDHPGIVPVHELGVDARGQAYFTMRLVRGRDLAHIFELADRAAEGWTLARTVNVLLKVCEAMAYAHSKGVVHRDLKPANVMVGQFGEVYVMDWGLARVRSDEAPRERSKDSDERTKVATDRRESSSGDSGSTLLTLDGEVLGTPSYMPPEQARGRLEEIDERSDIYAVGAMLYRLLAQRAPYDEPGQKRTAVEVLEALRAGPPTALEQRAPNAPLELIAVCSKAMARKRSERYATMLLLAEDLRAWLEGRVVAAYEAGAWAEARKWIRRNRALSAAAAAAVLALIGGLSASLWLGARAQRNAVLAEERRVAAEANAKEAAFQARVAEEVNSFLNDDLLAAMNPEHEGSQVTVRQVLDKAAAKLEGRFEGEPRVEAALRETIGTSYAKLGDNESALEHVERALELRKRDPLASEEERCEAMLRTAWVWKGLGRYQESIDLYEEVLERLESAPLLNAKGVSTAHNDLALALAESGRVDEATEHFEQALAVAQEHFGPDDPGTFVALSNLARHESDMGQYESAIARFDEILPRQRALLGARHPDAIATLNNASVAYNGAGRAEDAIRTAREALELCIDVYGPDHPLTARSNGNLGVGLFSLGRMSEAEQHFVESVRVFSALRTEDQLDLLQARGNLAGAWLELGRVAEALELSERNLEAERRVLGESHPTTLRTLNRNAVAYKMLGRFEDSERTFREAHALNVELFGAEHPSSIVVLENLGGMMFTQGRLEESERITREVLELRKRALGEAHPDVGKTSFNLGMLLRAKGDLAGARELFERALARDSGVPLELNPAAPMALQRLGDIELAEKDFEAADKYYLEALPLTNAQRPDGPAVGLLLHQRSAALRGLKRYDDALEVAREALAIRLREHGEHSVEARYTLAAIPAALLLLERFEECERALLELHENCLVEPKAEATFTDGVRAMLVRLYDAWGKPDEAARWR